MFRKLFLEFGDAANCDQVKVVKIGYGGRIGANHISGL